MYGVLNNFCLYNVCIYIYNSIQYIHIIYVHTCCNMFCINICFRCVILISLLVLCRSLDHVNFIIQTTSKKKRVAQHHHHKNMLPSKRTKNMALLCLEEIDEFGRKKRHAARANRTIR